MSSEIPQSNEIQPNNEIDTNTNPPITNEQNPDIPQNPEEEKKTEEQKIKKSKFNLLEQGRLMMIGNVDEVSKNLIIIGPKNSGKSSIFSLLTTRSPTNYSDSGTSGINYGFMRSQNQNQKKVMNVYEIGSGIENLILINTILNSDNIEQTIIFLVLDFNDPQKQLSSLLSYIKELKKILQKQIDAETNENLIKNKINLYPSKQRPSSVDVFPMNLYVIGNKYDILEKIDIEKLKWICPSLRYFCYVNALNIIFYSSKKKENINILYNTVNEIAFGSGKKENLRRYIQKRSTQALYIHYYEDCLEEIGEPKIPVTVTGDIEQRWKETYDGLFKNSKANDDNVKNIPIDKEFFDIYKEARIDHELKLFSDFQESTSNKEKENYLKASVNKYNAKKREGRKNK